MSEQRTVVFDIIGTCFSLEKPRQQLIELGAPNYTLELWFAQSLRDAFAFSHAGEYQPLKKFLQAELPRTMKLLDINLSSGQLEQIMTTFSELELQPGAKEAFQTLTEAGWRVLALTNGSKNSTRDLLERAAVQQYFTEIYSCDAIAFTKPHPDVYKMIQTDNLEETWLVAAHAWDIAGAKSVGMKTAFVRQLEKDYLEVYPQPQVTVENLLEAAHQIINTPK
ncbi:HAD hydrolase-like protein [Pleurocapsa sp. FMAR1]|uniref:HAD hydrolase-like protein n=1 Tax=Pleurocapsa sp. FMAR1 TaxID=3040204 RepID=UPI0029C73BD3|nr:HAD hydrolase-like protein [Pleurocapsa sp. FMAR1]